MTSWRRLWIQLKVKWRSTSIVGSVRRIRRFGGAVARLKRAKPARWLLGGASSGAARRADGGRRLFACERGGDGQQVGGRRQRPASHRQRADVVLAGGVGAAAFQRGGRTLGQPAGPLAPAVLLVVQQRQLLQHVVRPAADLPSARAATATRVRHV